MIVIKSFPNSIRKAGVDIKGDADKLNEDYGLEVNGWIDLRSYAELINPESSEW